MTSRDFCFWLQGYLEIAQCVEPEATPGLTPAQIACVQKHLALVFKHEIDPSMGDSKHQAALSDTHRPPRPGGGVLRC